MHSYIILFLFTHTCTILQACFPHMYTILHNLEINLFWLSCKQFLWILWHLKFTGCMCQHPNVIVWLNWNLKSFSQHHLQLIHLLEKLKLDIRTGHQMSKLVLNVKYLFLLSFLSMAEFYNLGHIQGILRMY